MTWKHIPSYEGSREGSCYERVSKELARIETKIGGNTAHLMAFGARVGSQIKERAEHLIMSVRQRAGVAAESCFHRSKIAARRADEVDDTTRAGRRRRHAKKAKTRHANAPARHARTHAHLHAHTNTCPKSQTQKPTPWHTHARTTAVRCRPRLPDCRVLFPRYRWDLQGPPTPRCCRRSPPRLGKPTQYGTACS